MSQWSYLLFGPFDYYLPFKAWEWHLKACQMWICIKSRAIYVSAGKGGEGELADSIFGRTYVFPQIVLTLNICHSNIFHSIFAPNRDGWLNIWSDVRFAPNSVDTAVDFLVTVCLLGNVYPTLVYISSPDTQPGLMEKKAKAEKEFDDQNTESKYLSIFQAMA